MSQTRAELAAIVVGHLLDINRNKCTITEAQVVAEEDEATRDILAGLLTVHEDLQYREEERARAVQELYNFNAELEQRVREQSMAMLELSTPLLEIWDGILVLPLVGMVDTARAQQVLEQALEAARDRHAAVLLLDVTGVPLIDTSVAKHLLKTVAALKLVGTDTILTGLGPANARVVAKLALDLDQIEPQGTLRDGLKVALERLRSHGLAGA